MATEHGMIEPFEPGQVRSSGSQRLISYGTSSYGYDVRCSLIQGVYQYQFGDRGSQEF